MFVSPLGFIPGDYFLFFTGNADQLFSILQEKRCYLNYTEKKCSHEFSKKSCWSFQNSDDGRKLGEKQNL